MPPAWPREDTGLMYSIFATGVLLAFGSSAELTLERHCENVIIFVTKSAQQFANQNPQYHPGSETFTLSMKFTRNSS
jgi:hypothetical protein